MTDSETDAYTPVACRFYDELGLRMMRGTQCRLVVETDGVCETVTGCIEDLYTEGEAEYIRLDDGSTIRLDHILYVENGSLNEE